MIRCFTPIVLTALLGPYGSPLLCFLLEHFTRCADAVDAALSQFERHYAADAYVLGSSQRVL
jgi:hypothetical protein